MSTVHEHTRELTAQTTAATAGMFESRSLARSLTLSFRYKLHFLTISLQCIKTTTKMLLGAVYVHMAMKITDDLSHQMEVGTP